MGGIPAAVLRAPGRTRRLGAARVAAWLHDWLLMLVWMGVLTGLGYLLGAASWRLGPVQWHLAIAAATVLPVTLWLAWQESRGATPGKRRRSLAVLGPDGGPPGAGRALLRNLLKVALPWQLGHLLAAFFMTTADTTTMPVWVYAVTALLYPLMALYVGTLFLGSGRTPYDVVAGTRVARGRAARV